MQGKCDVRRLGNGNLLVTVPMDLRWRGTGNGRKVVVDGYGGDVSDGSFLLALARGRRWQRLLDEGKVASAREIAEAIGRDPGFVARCIRLTAIAPDIVERAIAGEIPVGLSTNLARKSIPDSWDEQREMLLGE